ncbi:MAG: YqhA family protein [Berryella intestinalis]|nr:YqhA family protein [Berryella intestinalis]
MTENKRNEEIVQSAGSASADGRDAAETEASRRNAARSRSARQIASWTRIVAAIPSFGLLIIAVALSLNTLIEAVATTVGAVVLGDESILRLAALYVEYADLFLLSVALYLLSLGLFTLFISDNIPLPKWLTFRDFDDLKERLVAVICVMIGVSFLGKILEDAVKGLDLLWLGLSSGVIILTLTLFVKLVINHKGEDSSHREDEGLF